MKYLVIVGSAFLIGSVTAFAPRNAGVVARVNQQMTSPPTALQAFEFSQDVVVAGGAALAGIAFALSASGGKGAAAPKVAVVAEPKAEAVDVSIPYDAAARLAFGEMKGLKVDEATYQKFKEIYITKAVAQVTAKKVARDAALDAERFAAIAAQADKDMATLV